MIRVLLIRHGATAGNLEKRYIGRTDEPLCEIGVEQVQKLKKYLDTQNIQPDHLFVSPLLRTRQTAEILFGNMDQQLVPELKETDFGIFEGKHAEELAQDPQYRSWVNSMCLDPIPEGESVEVFKRRCCVAFEMIMRDIQENSIVSFVVHGGTIMAILEEFGIPHKTFYEYRIENGGCMVGKYHKHTISLI